MVAGAVHNRCCWAALLRALGLFLSIDLSIALSIDDMLPGVTRFSMCGSFLALVVAGAVALSACGPEEAAPSPEAAGDTTATDALGRTVTIPHPVHRVVSLAPNLTEIVYAAGAGPKLAAVTTADDFPPAVDTLPKVSALPVDFEAISAQNPDLVLATDQINAPREAETFDALNVPLYFFSFTGVADVFDAIRRTGRLLGSPDVAADSAAALAASLENLRERTATVSERPRVLVLIGDETLYAFGGSSYIHTLVEAAGGRSITADLDTNAPTLTEEYVLTERPDVIIGAWGADYDTDQILDLHPTWDVVPAVQNDRVYALPGSILLRPGPRLVQGARAMALRLHPSLFPSAPADSASSSL